MGDGVTSNSGTTYLVHLADGGELGPASLDDLRAWVEAGVVGKTTALSLAGSEVRIPAVSVQGLFGQTSVGPTTSASAQPQQPPPPSLAESPTIEPAQLDARSPQSPARLTTANFTRTTSDSVIGWVGVVLSALVFLMGIIVVAMDASSMSAGDIAGLVLMWLVNFVMATAFTGLIRARPWAFSLGLVAGILGTVTNVMGRALETPSKSEGGFEIGFLVLIWLVPILFGVYCWWRQNSVRQVGRV